MMGFMARLFGKAPKNSRLPKMSQLQSSTREQTQRQLLTMALRDTLKRNGWVPDSLSAEAVSGVVSGRAHGLHVQLVFREWEPKLLNYIVALEHAFRTTLRRLDPLSPSWMLGITWRFEPRNPLSWPQLPHSGPDRVAQMARSVTVTRASKKASLDTLLQSGDAAFRQRDSGDFTATLPMQAG
jgi:hypothetical protein